MPNREIKFTAQLTIFTVLLNDLTLESVLCLKGCEVLSKFKLYVQYMYELKVNLQVPDV